MITEAAVEIFSKVSCLTLEGVTTLSGRSQLLTPNSDREDGVARVRMLTSPQDILRCDGERTHHRVTPVDQIQVRMWQRSSSSVT